MPGKTANQYSWLAKEPAFSSAPEGHRRVDVTDRDLLPTDMLTKVHNQSSASTGTAITWIKLKYAAYIRTYFATSKFKSNAVNDITFFCF